MISKLITMLLLLVCTATTQAQSIDQVSEGITLQQAVALGFVYKTHRVAGASVWNFSFANFNACLPEKAQVQTFNKQGHLQKNIDLISKEGWYEFTTEKYRKNNWKLMVDCKYDTGLYKTYFITPIKKLL